MNKKIGWRGTVGKLINSCTITHHGRDEQFKTLLLEFEDGTFLEELIPTYCGDRSGVKVNPLDHEQTK